MKILKKNIKPEIILEECIAALNEGKLLILPSDTVYGLAVDATNDAAVQKLISFKQRPPGKAISVYIESIDQLSRYVKYDERQINLIKLLIPGPFTFVLKSQCQLVRKLEAENETLGVRFPAFQFINDLVRSYNSPITSTSANLSNQSSHYSVETLLNSLPEKKKEMIDLIVDFGPLPHNKPSTVIDLTTEQINTLRKGDISIEENIIISHSVDQTQSIAKNLMQGITNNNKPLVILIEGELGVGKTIFSKGIGDYLKITHMDSPSYLIYNEYKLSEGKRFIHFDLYNIQKEDEFEHLGIEGYLVEGNILCFEWGEKVGYIYERLKERANILYIKMEYIDFEKRKIEVSTLKS